MKRSKYGNVRTHFQGCWYMSQKEAQYAAGLFYLKQMKRVKSYEAQVSFPIVINGIKVCTYIADFVVNFTDGRQEVVDVKAIDQKTGKVYSTDLYKLKKKLVEAIYKIEILEK